MKDSTIQPIGNESIKYRLTTKTEKAAVSETINPTLKLDTQMKSSKKPIIIAKRKSDFFIEKNTTLPPIITLNTKSVS